MTCNKAHTQEKCSVAKSTQKSTLILQNHVPTGYHGYQLDFNRKTYKVYIDDVGGLQLSFILPFIYIYTRKPWTVNKIKYDPFNYKFDVADGHVGKQVLAGVGGMCPAPVPIQSRAELLKLAKLLTLVPVL